MSAGGESQWRSTVSFSERFASVHSLATKLRKDESIDATSAREQAKLLERKAFVEAESLAAYHVKLEHLARTTPAIGGCAQSASDDSASDREDSSLPVTAEVTIGAYDRARRYRDGLFSIVYKAQADQNPDAVCPVVALKVTTPALMTEPHDSVREARLLDGFRHDSIISLLDVFKQPGGRLVLVFPFLPYDLQTLLGQGGLNQSKVRSHLHDMFSALKFLHGLGIIHRDIKPSNILLKTRSGPAYLADFGIAWSPTDPASEHSSDKIADVGTTCYRPPELLFGCRNYDCSLDLWAAGCVVAEVTCCTGNTLFDSGDLGSELALLQSIFKALGTPDLETWPEAATFPDWGKMTFRKFTGKSWDELLPKASSPARDLASRLVRFESSDRLAATTVLKHDFFLQ